jgi:hypothetical protein
MVGALVLASVIGGERPWEKTDQELMTFPPIGLLLLATMYASYRIDAFHPVRQPAYLNWLVQTPWSWRKPLPLGPVHLVAADGVLLGAAFLAALPFHGWFMSLLVIKLFAWLYLVKHLSLIFSTYQWYPAYVSWFCLGGMILAWSSNWPFFAFAAVAYGASIVGLRRILQWYSRVPTRDEMRDATFVPSLTGQRHQTFFAWPFGYLAPRIDVGLLPRRHGILFSLLGGWTAYVAVSLLDGYLDVKPLVYMLTAQVALVAILVRVRVYRVYEYRPPISLAGRWQTGHWILPSHDQVYVAPLLAFVESIVVPSVLFHYGIEPSVATAIGITLLLMILLILGPDRCRWFLSSASRIVPLNRTDRGGQIRV